VSTSIRMQGEFWRLLFLQDHRETEAHFTAALPFSSRSFFHTISLTEVLCLLLLLKFCLEKCVCLLLQDLLQSCSRGGREIVCERRRGRRRG
jgi:hypothetical protein